MDSDTTSRLAHSGVESATEVFLRRCLRLRWRTASVEPLRSSAGRQSVNWDELIALARREGVAPLLYHGTRDRGILPAAVEASLRVDYLRTARRNLLWFCELEQALDRLAQAGIPVILLKGAAMAQAVYGNVALRPMVDIDLLVRKRHVPLALDTLSDLGYRYSGEANPRLSDVPGGQLMLRRPGPSETLIEVHWALFWFPFYQRSVSTEWLWRTAQPLRIGDASALALANEAQLLHLCGHLLHHHGGHSPFRLLWVLDLVELINRRGEEIDWGMLAAKAQESDLVLAVRQVLDQVAGEWPAPIPAEALDRLRTVLPTPNEMRARSWLEATTASMDRYPLASLAGLPDWRSRAAFLWHRLLFPSRAYMRRRYAIKDPLLVPLYYPYRWFSGLARQMAQWQNAAPRPSTPGTDPRQSTRDDSL